MNKAESLVAANGREVNASKVYSGASFGNLTAVKPGEDRVHPSGKITRRWVCLCKCGNFALIDVGALPSGHTKSCGCIQRQKSKDFLTTHGKSRAPEYLIWSEMKSRCSNPNGKYYKNYGGRGIRVCDEWKSFESFFSYVGPRPTPFHTIDRIDNNGNYEPGNVRWATRRQQNANQRRSVTYTVDGKTECLSEWARISGICSNTIRHRIKLGIPIKDAIFSKTHLRYKTPL